MRSRGKAYGPYKDRKGYRVVVKEGGSRSSRVFATERAAERFVCNINEALAVKEVTVADLLASYLHDKRDAIKPKTVDAVTEGVQRMMPDQTLEIVDIDKYAARKLYQECQERILTNGRRPSVATHQEALSVCRRVWTWAERNDIAESNPWRLVDKAGKANRGKVQLTRDQGRKLLETCLAADDIGAAMTLCCLVLGLRAGEVVAIRPEHIDDGGRVLIVQNEKADRSEPVELPVELVGPVRDLAHSALPSRKQVGYHVRKWCELAGVPPVTPHGLRGTFATRTRGAGVAAALVADLLRHNPATTRGHYYAPGADRQGGIAERLEVIDGGKSFRNRSAG